MKKIILLIFVISTVFSCTQDNTKILPQSTGKVHSILLIMDDTDWKESVGDSLRKYFAQEVIGLPQSEALFSLQQAAPELYNGIFKVVRNVIIIKKGDEAGVKFYPNKYADPQLIAVIQGKDNEEIKKVISQEAEKIISLFKKFDIKNLQQKNRRSLRVNDDVKKELGIEIEIPDFFNIVDHQGKFFWFRRDLKNGEADILLYEVPLKDSLDLKGDRVVYYRDLIGKKYIPGPSDSTYMKTVESVWPSQKEVIINDKVAIESRGLWDMKNDFMGGPYINYQIFDKKRNRIIVGEGFMYAPAIKKRDYMLQLEAILKTIKISE